MQIDFLRQVQFIRNVSLQNKKAEIALFGGRTLTTRAEQNRWRFGEGFGFCRSPCPSMVTNSPVATSRLHACKLSIVNGSIIQQTVIDSDYQPRYTNLSATLYP